MEFYFNKAKVGFDPNSADSKKNVISVLAPFLKRLTSQVEKAHWLTQLAFLLRAKEEAIEADVAVAKDDLEAYSRESSNYNGPLRSEGDEILSPAGRSDPLSETLLSLVMKDPILFKNELQKINPDLLDPYTAEAVVKLTAISSDNIADLLKDFREKNQSYKLEFAYLKSQELWKDSKEGELRIEFNNLINKLEERHLRTRLEKIGFEMRVGSDKDKKLALATEANKILNRLGEIQKI
ncbi:MAG: hypothetical protein HYT68_00200 [Candidatus Zambryskibacteria bacterium]|nr:hypothetical protein [Candidatus Zambryskibacteria bacterium]